MLKSFLSQFFFFLDLSFVIRLRSFTLAVVAFSTIISAGQFVPGIVIAKNHMSCRQVVVSISHKVESRGSKL